MSGPPLAPRLILASRSPRRRELLAEAGYDFDVVPPTSDIEPGIEVGEPIDDYLLRLASRKAGDVAQRLTARDFKTPYLIIGCDTVAVCAGQILGKPADEADAQRMLELLSGREHRVYSGLCLWPLPHGEPRFAVDVTVLRMDRLTDAQLDEYLASGQWAGKAGAFGYQDRTGWLHVVEGSESNVVGLPMELLARMLAKVARGAFRGE